MFRLCIAKIQNIVASKTDSTYRVNNWGYSLKLYSFLLHCIVIVTIWGYQWIPQSRETLHCFNQFEVNDWMTPGCAPNCLRYASREKNHDKKIRTWLRDTKSLRKSPCYMHQFPCFASLASSSTPCKNNAPTPLQFNRRRDNVDKIQPKWLCTTASIHPPAMKTTKCWVWA